MLVELMLPFVKVNEDKLEGKLLFVEKYPDAAGRWRLGRAIEFENHGECGNVEELVRLY